MTPTFFPCYATPVEHPVEQGPKGKHLCLVQDVYSMVRNIGGIFIIVSMLVSVADDVG